MLVPGIQRRCCCSVTKSCLTLCDPWTVAHKRHYSADKVPYSQGYSLPSGCVRLWELDHKEGRMTNNWCFQTVVLWMTPESPLDSSEIKPVNLKEDQPWIFTGRTDAKAETQVVWSSDENRWPIGKVPDAGKDWGQEKRASEDENGITDEIDMNLGKLQEMVRDREDWCATVHAKGWTQLDA